MEAFFALIAFGLAAWVFLGPLFVFLRLRSVQNDLTRTKSDLESAISRLSDAEKRIAAGLAPTPAPTPTAIGTAFVGPASV